MLTSWLQYTSRFIPLALNPPLSLLDRLVVVVLVFMTLVCMMDAYMGHDIGDYKKLQWVKLKAQQEMVAVYPEK